MYFLQLPFSPQCPMALTPAFVAATTVTRNASATPAFIIIIYNNNNNNNLFKQSPNIGTSNTWVNN
jgi:hypothetical protein